MFSIDSKEEVSPEKRVSIKLIASDLDGTILRDGAQQCSSRLYELIQALYEKGVLFVPASGRQYPNMRRLFGHLDEQILYLCENGALVMRQNEPVFQWNFKRELALAISNAIIDRPECEIIICCPKASYTIPKTAEFVSYMRDEIGYTLEIIERPEQITESILKVSYYTDPALRSKIGAEIYPRFAGQCLMVESGNEWVDFAPFGVSKGNALACIGEALGIAPEEMAAFGDNENDRTMLEYVGHPYRMDTSSPIIKDIPAKICRRVEDELQEILDSFFE